MLPPAHCLVACVWRGGWTVSELWRNSGPFADVQIKDEQACRSIGMETQADRDAIADEAVGQRHESAPPEAQKRDELSPEEFAQRLARGTGAQASIPEKTAESMGERVADAY